MSAEIDVVTRMIAPFVFLLGMALFVLIIHDICLKPSKSQTYRRTLADMYVSGKIKQIAKKDGIDLNEEFLDFAKVTKNNKINLEYLDTTVERELQEKISDTKPTSEGKATVPKEE